MDLATPWVQITARLGQEAAWVLNDTALVLGPRTDEERGGARKEGGELAASGEGRTENCLGFRFSSLGCGVWGVGCGVLGVGCGIYGVGCGHCRVLGVGCGLYRQYEGTACLQYRAAGCPRRY